MKVADRRRVLVIVQNLPVPRDRRVWLECRSLQAEGYEVSVICPQGGDTRSRASYEVLEGVHIFRYRPPPTTRGTLSFFYEFAYCWLRTALLSVRVARRVGFDVMQACNPPDTYWLLALLWRPWGKRFVFDQHDLCPETYESRFGRRGALHRMLLRFERWTYRLSHHVISTNESYRAVALTRGKLPADHVTIVRTGPDPELMQRGSPDPSCHHGRDHLAVYLGVMGPQDGVDLAIRAAHHLITVRGRTDITFALMGRGDSYDDMRALVDELGITDYVVMPGFTPDERVFAYLSSADVGLCPDPLNPLNDVSTMNKTMEYMAFGLPVVAFDLVETRFSALDAAVYATPNDVAEFGDLVAELIDDPVRSATMGAAGRRRVEEVLAWRHQAPTYVSVYDRLFSS
jgi:glycosyltransferase involved in cell wall biosynthesis